ncbi:hypothetical protein GCK72_003307 [Caenorhabditis remanei]|uniref:Sdz-33 F-box domain-containing protein n=1 Tax=Caenorhabditis remanei TaxID=31234 RepID=A0A6A5HTD6_CAERE|nr:hypothetical protein GCK72_003307 [Caenorhabditis remanei]KAF1771480.1 hypothetical protein GCK72_003307 [Caenorhabditis remanei]
MTTPFRLFFLPYVPLKQVLDNVGPETLIILSLCSLRSKSIVVSYKGPSKNVQLKLHFGSEDSLVGSYGSGESIRTYIRLTVEQTGKLTTDETLETVRIGSFEKVPVKRDYNFMKGKHIKTYWEDRMTGLAAIGDYGREIFNRDISEVMIGEKQAEDDHRRAAEWVKNSQGTIQSLRCNFKPKIDKDLDFILENFNYTKKLHLAVEPSHHYSPAKLPNFQIGTLDVFFSFWIKQEHLLKMDCKTVTLHAPQLRNQDFNVFLKHWLAGGCSKVKDLSVGVSELFDYQIVFDGVDFVERESDLERVFVDEDGTDYTIMGGYDVKRSNITATITKQSSSHFWFIVW